MDAQRQPRDSQDVEKINAALRRDAALLGLLFPVTALVTTAGAGAWLWRTTHLSGLHCAILAVAVGVLSASLAASLYRRLWLRPRRRRLAAGLGRDDTPAEMVYLRAALAEGARPLEERRPKSPPPADGVND